MCYLSNPFDEGAVYLIESVVWSLHIYKRVWSPTVFARAFNLYVREDRNDDCFAVCLQV